MARRNFADAMKEDNELFKSRNNKKSRDEYLKELEEQEALESKIKENKAPSKKTSTTKTDDTDMVNDSTSVHEKADESSQVTDSSDITSNLIETPVVQNKQEEIDGGSSVMTNAVNVSNQEVSPVPVQSTTANTPVFAPVQPAQKATHKLYVEISEENYLHLKRESGALGMQIKTYVDQLFDFDRTSKPHHYMD